MAPGAVGMRKPFGAFVGVAVEASILGMLALGGLASGRGRGDCGSVCHAATPYLVVAAALCGMALAGSATVWLLGRSGLLYQLERIAFRIGAVLFTIVLVLFVVVILISGAHVD